jgi:hypothetical protein
VHHAPGAIAPPDAEVVQVGDAIWQRRCLVQGAVSASVVVLDPGAALGPSRCPGLEVRHCSELELQVDCQDSMIALSSADPGLPIDWAMPSQPQTWRTVTDTVCQPMSSCPCYRLSPGKTFRQWRRAKSGDRPTWNAAAFVR